MTITISTGTQLAIASTYGPVVAMSALSNAAEAVGTLAGGHGAIVGDYVELTSGWDLLNGRIARVGAVATNDVTFEDIDTSSVTNYPAGTGIGSIRRITEWTTVGQIQSVSGSGGELNFADVTTVTDRTQKQMPTTRSPRQTNIVLFDDASLAGQAAIQAASNTSSVAAMRTTFPSGSKIVKNGYWSIGEPEVNTNQPLTNQVGFSEVALYTRYAT